MCFSCWCHLRTIVPFWYSMKKLPQGFAAKFASWFTSHTNLFEDLKFFLAPIFRCHQHLFQSFLFIPKVSSSLVKGYWICSLEIRYLQILCCLQLYRPRHPQEIWWIFCVSSNYASFLITPVLSLQVQFSSLLFVILLRLFHFSQDQLSSFLALAFVHYLWFPAFLIVCILFAFTTFLQNLSSRLQFVKLFQKSRLPSFWNFGQLLFPPFLFQVIGQLREVIKI